MNSAMPLPSRDPGSLDDERGFVGFDLNVRGRASHPLRSFVDRIVVMLNQSHAHLRLRHNRDHIVFDDNFLKV